jgi:hypothetical protein
MGMFDRYEPRPAVSCPACGSALSEWQGQTGPCGLLRWIQGCAAPVAERFDFSPSDEVRAASRLPIDFEIHTSCQSCDYWVDALGTCEAGVWTRVDLICPLEQRDLPDDWLPLRGNEALSALEQLRREMPAAHVLAARKLFAMAQHRERDEDILFRSFGTDTRLWLVTLTWRSETWRSDTDPELPRARPFRDLAELIALH